MVGEGSKVGQSEVAAAPSGSSLSAVVVGYRQPDLMAQAAAALDAGSRAPCEVVLVDVDPIDPIAVRPETPSAVRVVTTTDNPGYAAACDRGSDGTAGDWLLFMNADVTVSPTALAGVLDEVSSDDAIGIATCRLELPDGRLDHACHRGVPSVFDSLAYKLRLDRLLPRSRTLGHYRLTWLDTRETHDIEACSGAFLLIRREAFDAVGGWDEAYRFYAEDLDLCLRVRQAGWRVRYVGTATALHQKGAASHLQADPRSLSAEQRTTRQRVSEDVVASHERFYERHLEADTPRILRPLVGLMFRLQHRRLGRHRG